MNLERQKYYYRKELRSTPERISFAQGPVGVMDDEKEWIKLDKEIASGEHSFNLMSGTVNLINTLYKRTQEGEPVDTLVFMDKAARMAAYIFYKTWPKVEGFMSEDRSEVVKPKIRYLNAYSQAEQRPNKLAYQSLGNLYRKEDMSGNVLVVDEVVISGTSIINAVESILEACYQPRSLGAIQQFVMCPDWYIAITKGVQDGPILRVDEVETINKLPAVVQSQMLILLKAVGVRDAVNYLQDLPNSRGYFKPTPLRIWVLSPLSLFFNFELKRQAA